MQAAENFSMSPLLESEVEVYVEILNTAFLSVLKQLEGKTIERSADRFKMRFFRPGTTVYAIRDAENQVQAVLPIQKAGTRAVPGPIGVSHLYQRPWKSGVSEALVGRINRHAAENDCAHIDSVTFPASTTHLALYWKYGRPLFPSVYLEKKLKNSEAPGNADGDLEVQRFSSLDKAEQEAVLEQARQLTGKFFPGYDLENDFRYVQEQRLGDTFLISQRGELLGFSNCHDEPHSEVFHPGQLLIKHLYVQPDSAEAERVFHCLMQVTEEAAREKGLKFLVGNVSTARQATFNALLERSYQPRMMDTQWLMLPADPNPQPLQEAIQVYQPHQFAMTEWR